MMPSAPDNGPYWRDQVSKKRLVGETEDEYKARSVPPMLATRGTPDEGRFMGETPDEFKARTALRAGEPNIYERCRDFLREVTGDDPSPDSVRQLSQVFLPCLKIMNDRPYNRDGETWREAGWKGNLYEVLKRAFRLRKQSWKGSNKDLNDALDIINYAGFYLRCPEPWGELGKPE